MSILRSANHLVLVAAACGLVACSTAKDSSSIDSDEAKLISVQTQEEPKVEPAALKVLEAMSKNLASAKTLKVNASTLFDVSSPTGLKSLTAMKVACFVKRPNMLHARYNRDDGASRFIWYDGKNIARYEPHTNNYARAELKMPSLGALADHLIDNYDLNLTLGDFLYDDPKVAFLDGVISGVHKGYRYVDGVVCDYLSFESAGADFQLWVTSGDNPVPKRFVVTYVTKPGEPQYIANLTWHFDAYLDDGMFRFNPPASMTEVPLKKRK